MTKRFFIFDTETTGLFANDVTLYTLYNKISKNEENILPLSIAYSILEVEYDDSIVDKSVIKNQKLIKHQGDLYFDWNVEISAFITNLTGIDAQIIKERADRTPGEVVEQFALDLLSCDALVAHNLLFDGRILFAAFNRIIETEPDKKEYIEELYRSVMTLDCICTAQISAMLFGTFLTDNYGSTYLQLNRTKLEKLHIQLLGKAFENAHNASNDTQALTKIFIVLLHKYETNVLKTQYGAELYLSCLSPETYESAKTAIGSAIPPIDSHARLNYSSILFTHQRATLRNIRKQTAIAKSIFGLPALA